MNSRHLNSNVTRSSHTAASTGHASDGFQTCATGGTYQPHFGRGNAPQFVQLPNPRQFTPNTPRPRYSLTTGPGQLDPNEFKGPENLHHTHNVCSNQQKQFMPPTPQNQNRYIHKSDQKNQFNASHPVSDFPETQFPSTISSQKLLQDAFPTNGDQRFPVNSQWFQKNLPPGNLYAHNISQQPNPQHKSIPPGQRFNYPPPRFTASPSAQHNNTTGLLQQFGPLAGQSDTRGQTQNIMPQLGHSATGPLHHTDPMKGQTTHIGLPHNASMTEQNNNTRTLQHPAIGHSNNNTGFSQKSEPLGGQNTPTGMQHYQGQVTGLRYQAGLLTGQNAPQVLLHQSGPPQNIPTGMQQHAEFSLMHQTYINPHANKALEPHPSSSIEHGCASSYSETEQDKQWVENWITKKKMRISDKQIFPSITLSEAQKKYGGLLELMNDLERQLTVTQEMHLTTADRETWDNAAHNMETTAYEIEKLKQQLTDETVVKDLSRKIQLRRKKRERLKKQRKEKYEEEQEMLKRREIKHQIIDAWRNAIAQKVTEEKQAKELKSLADQMLSEVRKKTADVTKTFDRIQGLQALRKLRKERAERQGVYTSPSMDQMFNKQIDQLTDLVSPRQPIYEAEMKTLMVMLETEHEESMEKEKKKSKQLQLQKEKNEKQKMNEMLFGEDESLDSLDPLLPFRNFYNQANFSFDAFIQIRAAWDSFTVPSETPQSSRIPDGWVLPADASSDVWASALKDS